MQNSMVSENQVLIFKFSKKQIPNKVIFSWSERIEIFVIKFMEIFLIKFLQAVANLDKKLEIFIFILFNFLFSKIFSTLVFHLAVAFQQYQIYQI